MTTKRKSLYLFLTLACFLGIIAIFVFDGYMGVYDTLVMDNGQYKQTVEADQWSQQERYGGLMSIGVEHVGFVDFTYTIENHSFSEYSTNVEASLWYNREKIDDILTDTVSVNPFDKSEFKWSINTSDIVPADYSTAQNYNVNMIIKNGDVEREVLINIYASPNAIKGKIPIPPPQ